MSGASVDLWPAIVDPDRCPLPAAGAGVDAVASRLADLVSPALAQHLLMPLERRMGRPLVDPGRAEKSLLLNRFTRRAQAACARRLHATPPAVVPS